MKNSIQNHFKKTTSNLMHQPFGKFYRDQNKPSKNASPFLADMMRVNILIENPLNFKLFGNLNVFYSFAIKFFRNRYHENKEHSKKINNSLKIHRIIGKGSFGTVAFGTLNSVTCAVKIFDRSKLVKTKQAQRTINEKNMLQGLIHPNIVPFLASFKDNSNLYICMSLVNGGELYTHMRRVKRFDEETSKQLIAQVVLAFEYLQQLNVAHRDIKPENMLLDMYGYLKVTDFGFAKYIKSKTYTLCGTPEYLAPEVISQRGYGLTTDWWAIGILTYELNYGTTPFVAIEHDDIYQKATKGKYKKPEFFSKPLLDLVSRLLVNDTSKRLGCTSKGSKDVVNHPWFADIDWWEIFCKRVDMKYKPIIKNATDLSNFDTAKVNLKEAENEIHRTIFLDF